MKKTTIIMLGIAICLCTILSLNAGKVGILGHSYGRYDVKLIINRVLVSKGGTVLYENLKTTVPVDRLKDFSLIIVCTATSKALTADEMKKLQEYVTNGGHLILIQAAPRVLVGGWGPLKKGALKWAGIKYIEFHKKGLQTTVLKSDSELLKGAKMSPAPPWLKAGYTCQPTPEMQNIIGTKKYSQVGITTVGKGWVAYLGHELFRLRSKRNFQEKNGAYEQIIRNLVKMAAPTDDTGVKQSMLGKFQKAGKDLLVWNREWQRGERYGPRFDPPLPRPDELIKGLSADMALNEYESLQLNITPIKKYKLIDWQIVGGPFAKKNVQFFVQDRPEPIPWKKNPKIAKEFPFWLMPPQYVEPKGKKQFVCSKPGDPRIMWLRVSSFGVKPGDYKFTLKLTFDGKCKVDIPVNIKVYPVRVARKRLIGLGVGGQVYGSVWKPAPALRLANDLEAHGNEWSLITSFIPARVKLVESGDFIKNRQMKEIVPKILNGEDVMVDFGVFDPWMEQAISHNLTQFKLFSVLKNIEGALRRAKIPKKTWGKIKVWYVRQVQRYLREKGIRVIVSCKGDELSRKEIYESWLPWAKIIKAGGMDCTSTFSFGNKEYRDLVRDVSPYVKLWTFNQGLHQRFVNKVRSGEIKIREDAIIGTYGAGEGRGSESRKPKRASRYLGWDSWKSGITNCMPNPYFKSWIYYCDYGDRGQTGGIAGERWVAYLNKDDLSAPMADCPFWEGVREGLEEGNLAAQLSWYLEQLKAAGVNTPEVRRIAAELDAVVNTKPGSIIKQKVQNLRGFDRKVIKANRADFRKAKQKVLELTCQLKPVIKKHLKPNVLWNEIPLIEKGQAVASISGNLALVKALNAKVKELCDMTLPTGNNGKKVRIVIGNGQQNPQTATILKACNSADATDKYPGKNSYFIKEFSKDGITYLVIAGPDDKGTAKGVKMFTHFLIGRGTWVK
jgi:hypothetical protein